MATLVTVTSVFGTVQQDPLLSVEYQFPPTVLLVACLGVAVAMCAGWTVRGLHANASLGLSIATAALLVPVWAGVTWLLAPASAPAALATAPLATAGVAHVAFRWTAAPHQASRALLAVYVLIGAASLVHLIGYDPFEDPHCMRTCVDMAPVASDLLETRSAQVVSGALTIGASALALAGCARARRSGVPSIVVMGVLVSTSLLAVSAGFEVIFGASRSISVEVLTAVPVAAGSAIGAATSTSGLRSRQSARRGRAASGSSSLPPRSRTTQAPRSTTCGSPSPAATAGWTSGPADGSTSGRGSVVLSHGAGPVLGFPTERPHDLPAVLRISPGRRGWRCGTPSSPR